MAKGVIIIVAIWAGMIAWIANLARSLGANILGWTLMGAVLGGVGFAAGLGVSSVALNQDDSSTGVIMLAVLIPFVLMMAGMLLTGALLKRGVIGGPRRVKWNVHIFERGDGTLRVDRDRVLVEWPEGSREFGIAQLRSVQADGECVRLQTPAEGDLVVMPLGESLSPEGRRRMSLQITQRLRVALPVAVARS